MAFPGPSLCMLALWQHSVSVNMTPCNHQIVQILTVILQLEKVSSYYRISRYVNLLCIWLYFGSCCPMLCVNTSVLCNCTTVSNLRHIALTTRLKGIFAPILLILILNFISPTPYRNELRETAFLQKARLNSRRFRQCL